MNSSKKRVIVGMSGGVDSSVAALLLKEQGFIVEGLFMKNWEEDDDSGHCHAAQDVKDAEAVANLLKIPLHTVNFSKAYWENVFEHCLSEFQCGRTPNPDILCNREIKFKLFLNYALNLGADYIATGHYATLHHKNNAAPELHKARDLQKDQSYFLYTLTQEALAKTLFPLNELSKETVRNIARDAGFLNFNKKDSTGICFIGERKFSPFLKRYLKSTPGNIENPEGRVLGQHEGLTFYTIGQRQGLHIGGQANTNNDPWYVVGKEFEGNVLRVAQGEKHPLLYSNGLIATNLHWISGQKPGTTFQCSAKIRYRQHDQMCQVYIRQNSVADPSSVGNNEVCKVIFKEPQRAITPGQAIVFYQKDHCLGGGTIQETRINNDNDGEIIP